VGNVTQDELNQSIVDLFSPWVSPEVLWDMKRRSDRDYEEARKDLGIVNESS